MKLTEQELREYVRNAVNESLSEAAMEEGFMDWIRGAGNAIKNSQAVKDVRGYHDASKSQRQFKKADSKTIELINNSIIPTLKKYGGQPPQGKTWESLSAVLQNVLIPYLPQQYQYNKPNNGGSLDPMGQKARQSVRPPVQQAP
jgi:hypothetical protein